MTREAKSAVAVMVGLASVVLAVLGANAALGWIKPAWGEAAPQWVAT